MIIGILAALTLPVVRKAYPDKLEAMHRKSYYILENTVSQIYNDDDMYLKKADKSLYGFKNTETIKYKGKIYGGVTKFCELYSDALIKRINTKISCTPNARTFTSADNVDWYIPVTNFSEGSAPITFDVNGKAEPNCEYNAKTCKKPDKFTYYIMSNGKITTTNPNPKPSTYCINTEITGEGNVTPGPKYCNLQKGDYTLTSIPKTGWVSSWVNNKKNVRIEDSDITLLLKFTELPKACITLNVNCESGLPNMCGSYSISGGTFTASGNTLKSCNLLSNHYTVIVTPKSTHNTVWQTQTINLDGIDRTLDVTLTEKKYCASLDVSCPGGGANICGTYTLLGNGTTYDMDSLGIKAKTCALRNGDYRLEINANKGYKADKTSESVKIAGNNWDGEIKFDKKLADCLEDDYFELADGRKFVCPYRVSYRGDSYGVMLDDCRGDKAIPSADDIASIANELYKKKVVPYKFSAGGGIFDLSVLQRFGFCPAKGSRLSSGCITTFKLPGHRYLIGNQDIIVYAFTPNYVTFYDYQLVYAHKPNGRGDILEYIRSSYDGESFVVCRIKE